MSALLDDATILVCMQYADLNPIRAGITDSIESSDFTSGQDRLTDLQQASKLTTTKAADHTCEYGKNAGWMVPVQLEPKRMAVRQNPAKRRCSNKGFLSMTLAEYLQLQDWTSTLPRREGHSGCD